jgi:hypothetical protein
MTCRRTTQRRCLSVQARLDEAAVPMQSRRLILHTVGRALLGATAGACIAPYAGVPFLFVFAALHVPATEEFVSQYRAVSAGVGAVLGAILGVMVGASIILTGARSEFFNPLGMFVGLASGATLGATFASLCVFSPHPVDMRDAIIFTWIATLLGGVAGGFVGSIAWTILGGTMVGWIIFGLASILITHHRLGLIYEALFGAPLGAIVGFRLGLWFERTKSTKEEIDPLPEPTVWDADLDRPD